MASLRKKYSTHIVDAGPRQDEPPVTTPPEITAAELPPVADAKPPEQPTTESPADVAARTALKSRLAEMERAEQLAQQQQQPQQPPQHAEPPQQQPEIPAAVAKFLAENPRYADPDDAISQAEIYTATLKCNRDGLNWNDDDFIPAIERHLGLRPAATNGHSERHKSEIPNENFTSPPTPRPAAPRRQPAVRPSAAPVSAPPTRQVPSMSTGRAPSYRAPLTKDELEIAAASGQTPEQYQAQKERWQKMKAEGAQ